MLGGAPRSERAEHHQDQKSTTAANDQWKQNGQDSATRLCFMRTSKADATKDNVPYSCDHTATQRDNHQWKYGPAGETNYSECRFKRLFRAAHDHYADMQ